MGTGRRHGRPEDSAAAAAVACAQLVESVRSGDAGAFTTAVERWCEAVFADDGWGLWLWDSTAFELRARGGRPAPPEDSLDAVTRSLRTDATRSELATGRAVVLDPAAAGPDTTAAVVAFGSPARLLAVLATFRQGARSVIAGAELGALTAAARLCTVALAAPPQLGTGDTAETVAAPSAARLQPALLADLRDALAAIVGFSHTLIRSEHRLGRVQRRLYHAVIERQALALSGTVDDIAIVSGAVAEGVDVHPLAPGDRDAFGAELAARLGPDADVTVGTDVADALPAVADHRALALALAGLADAVAVAASGGSHVDVAAATSATVGRVGVAAHVGGEPAARLVDLVRAVGSGAEDVVWSGRTSLAVAAAGIIARAHRGTIGAAAEGEVVRIWLDLPHTTAAS